MLLIWNHGLIRFPVVAESRSFFIRGWSAIPKYPVRITTPISVGIKHHFVVVSLYRRNPNPNFDGSAEDKCV